MNNELVSIVMATYNGEKYLRKQLDSILEQTYQHFELIAVDDASTDKTLSILQEYAKLDDRIHVFSAEKNLGLISNFERGLKLARGNFIALSDQDDIFRKDKIELLRAKLKEHPEKDLVLSDLSLIDGVGHKITHSMWSHSRMKPREGKPFWHLLHANFATGCAMMFTRKLLELVMPFPPDCIVHDWWIAVVASSSRAGGICLLHEQLTAYRQHGSNVLGAKEASRLEIGVIISRLKAAPRGKAVFESRMRLYKVHLDRLAGYLQSSVWSSADRKEIEIARAFFLEYRDDPYRTLIERSLKLPKRLRHAWVLGGFVTCISVVMHTISPYK